MVSEGLATLHELQTVYTLRDLYDFLEIIAVNGCNARRIRKHGKDKPRVK